MIKTTKEDVENQAGVGNILITVYNYLRDKSFLLGTYKNPIVTQEKARTPHHHYAKHQTTGNFQDKPFFSYKNLTTDKEVRLVTFNVTAISNKIVSFDIYKNATLTGAVWEGFDEADHVDKDTSATAYTGGKFVGGVDIQKEGGEYLPLSERIVYFTCMPNDIITIVVTTDQSSDLYLRVRLEEI